MQSCDFLSSFHPSLEWQRLIHSITILTGLNQDCDGSKFEFTLSFGSLQPLYVFMQPCDPVTVSYLYNILIIITIQAVKILKNWEINGKIGDLVALKKKPEALGV